MPSFVNFSHARTSFYLPSSFLLLLTFPRLLLLMYSMYMTSPVSLYVVESQTCCVWMCCAARQRLVLLVSTPTVPWCANKSPEWIVQKSRVLELTQWTCQLMNCIGEIQCDTIVSKIHSTGPKHTPAHTSKVWVLTCGWGKVSLLGRFYLYLRNK